MFKCWHPKDRARDGIAAVMVHLSFCLLSGILQIRCEMMFTFAGCGMQYSICSDRLKKEKKNVTMALKKQTKRGGQSGTKEKTK